MYVSLLGCLMSFSSFSLMGHFIKLETCSYFSLSNLIRQFRLNFEDKDIPLVFWSDKYFSEGVLVSRQTMYTISIWIGRWNMSKFYTSVILQHSPSILPCNVYSENENAKDWGKRIERNAGRPMKWRKWNLWNFYCIFLKYIDNISNFFNILINLSQSRFASAFFHFSLLPFSFLFFIVKYFIFKLKWERKRQEK